MTRNRRLIILLVSILGVALIRPNFSNAGEIYSVSLKDFPTPLNERVVGFKVRLLAANIYSVPKVPIGWAFNITNSLNEQPPWNTIIDASIGIGNAALYQQFFEDFLTIEKYIGKWAENLEFDIEVRLTVTVDFEKYTQKTFKMNDVILKRIKKE